MGPRLVDIVAAKPEGGPGRRVGAAFEGDEMSETELHRGETLGDRKLTTIHAVAQALAIGPMFSVALILGGISRPDIGAGFSERTATITANRPGFALRVTPVSATQQQFELTATGPLAPEPTLRFDASSEKVTRSLALRPDGAAWRTEGLAFPRDGAWSASVSLADGGTACFEIDRIDPATAWNDLSVLLPTDHERLTLQTSTSYTPTAPRFLVVALPCASG